MALGLLHCLQKAAAHVLDPAGDLSVLLHLQVQAFHGAGCVGFPQGALRILSLFFGDGAQVVQMIFGNVAGVAQIAQHISSFGKTAPGQHRHRAHRQVFEQFMPPVGGEKLAAFPVQHIELHKIVGQRIVENAVLGVHPLAVHHVAAAQHLPESLPVDARPLLEQLVVLLPVAAGQVMAPALEQQLARGIKGQGRVGPVDFFFDHQRQPGDFIKGDLGKILVAGLQAGTLDVGRAGVFDDAIIVHGESFLISTPS